MQPEPCPWCLGDPLYRDYHDCEWGRPCGDDRTLFEFLLLEGAQAGLAWITVLKKRAHYRRVFDAFDPQRIARYDRRKLEQLLADPGIIRNRRKLESAVGNARACLAVSERHPSFAHYLWQFADFQPRQNRFASLAEVPASTPQSERMSKALRRDGFNFVGPTICYAFMQAVGMVNDHLVSCPQYAEVAAEQQAFALD